MKWKIYLTKILVLIFCVDLNAQYKISSSTFSTGFGTSTNSTNKLSGVIGETLTGCIANGSHVCTTGFIYVQNIGGSVNSVKEINASLPNNFKLEQNYPNPFNPSTKIHFSIPRQTFVKLSVYDVLGKKICILVDKEMLPGNYETTFDGMNYSSGIYFYRIETEEITRTSKMILMK